VTDVSLTSLEREKFVGMRKILPWLVLSALIIGG